ncbi:hypothetical protein NP493_619g04002 [Ridgeia piscesae]|uniref:Sema domain-containing protein n=1 Tax=Ridgeia piscesae TaxID=27915 RepID=A0AAD9KUP5_RIDPI|nr:hypothetical protein NP493_619g04002 [Ridgeia piscesae]
MCRHSMRVNLVHTFCLFCLVVSQAESSKSYLRTFVDSRSMANDSMLQRLSLDVDTGDIFVAGRNVLYRLCTNLTLQQSVSLGPVCEQSDAASVCTLSTDNDPRLLLPFPGGRHLLFCGTSEHGLCSVYDTAELSGRTMAKDSKLSHLGGDSSVVALFANGGSVGNEETTLYVGHARDRRPNTLSPPVFAALTITKDTSDILKAVYRYENVGTGIRTAMELSDEGRRQDFRYDFIYTFKHGGFVYFVTVQRNNTSLHMPYVTKLARVCQADPGFYSYTEVQLG